MIFGTFHRLTTLSILGFFDVAAARSDFEFTVCLGILEFLELGHRRMVALSVRCLAALSECSLTQIEVCCPHSDQILMIGEKRRWKKRNNFVIQIEAT